MATHLEEVNEMGTMVELTVALTPRWLPRVLALIMATATLPGRAAITASQIVEDHKQRDGRRSVVNKNHVIHRSNER